MAFFVFSGAMTKIDLLSGAHAMDSIQLSKLGARRRVAPFERSYSHSSHRSDSNPARDCDRHAIQRPSGEYLGLVSAPWRVVILFAVPPASGTMKTSELVEVSG